MSIRLTRRLSLPRVMIGGILTVVGIHYVSTGHDGFGALFMLSGLVVGIRGAFEPVLFFLAGTIQFVLMFGWIAWGYTSLYRLSLDDWLSENWGWGIYIGVIVFGPIVDYFLRRESAWKALQADFSEVPEWQQRSNEYPTASGLLLADDDQIDVQIIPIEPGMVFGRLSGGHLFFPWEVVQEIRIRDEAPRRAIVRIFRRTSIPLTLEIPWDPRFTKWVPASVSIYGT